METIKRPLTARILLIANNSKRDYIKEFGSLDSFNEYKEVKLTFNKSITYQIRYNDETMYSPRKTEVSNNVVITKDKNKLLKNNDNTVQKNSRHNNLTVVGNDMINLSLTPQRKRKINTYIKEKPLIPKEIKALKSVLHYDELSVKQYYLVEDILAKADRRKKIS